MITLLIGAVQILSLVATSVPLPDNMQHDGMQQPGLCPSCRLFDPVSERTYTIPEMRVGRVYSSPPFCLANGRPFVTIECLLDDSLGAQWSRFEPNQACNFSDMSTSHVTASLKRLCSMDLPLSEVLNASLTLMQEPNSLTALDVIYITDVVQLGLSSGKVSPTNARSVLEIADILMAVNGTVLQESRRRGNATNRLIAAIDRLGDQIELNGNQPARFVTESIALLVTALSPLTHHQGDLIVGLEYRLIDGVSSPVLRSEALFSLFENGPDLDLNLTDVAIFLPGDFLRNVKQQNPGKDVRLSLNVFADTALFGNGRLESRMATLVNPGLNSKVVSARLTVNGEAITNLTGHNLTTAFLPSKTLDKMHVQRTRCVFWNFGGASGLASWSDEGCSSQESVDGRDVCQFDHLTNFAVLVDLYGQSNSLGEHEKVLSMISILGLSFSIAGLSINIVAFLRISKLRQGRRQQVLFNLSLAMLLSWVVFLAGFTRSWHGNNSDNESYVSGEDSKSSSDNGVVRTTTITSCVAVAALLHYLILVSFLWMLVEGLLAYLMLVKVFDASLTGRAMLKTTMAAWGLPVLPVIVVLSIDPHLYQGGENYCWMSTTPFFYAFLLPLAAVMLVNIVIYVLVVINLHRRRTRGGLAVRANRSPSSQRAVEVRASVACFIVLGLSWVFAFFAIEDARVVFQYLFTITASLQGFLIFLVFTASATTSGFRRIMRSLSRSALTSASSSTSSSSGSGRGGDGGAGGGSGDKGGGGGRTPTSCKTSKTTTTTTWTSKEKPAASQSSL